MISAGENSNKAPTVVSQKQLEESVVYVSKNWFPFQQDVLDTIKEKIRTGQYNNNADALLLDLKKDFSLFTWFLSRNTQQVKEGVAQLQTGVHALRQFEISQFEKLLQVPESGISIHSSDAALKPQQMCLRQSVLSSTAAEMFAEKGTVDPFEAFTCSSVRSLGLNLISWNYPRIFSRSLTQVKEKNQSIDDVLTEMLGFSPQLLGAEVSLGWTNDSTLKEASKDIASRRDEGIPSNLTEICDTAAAVAHLADPEIFSITPNIVDSLSVRAQSFLGPQALTLLERRFAELGKELANLIPDLADLELKPHLIKRKLTAVSSEKYFKENLPAQKIAPALAEKLKEVYQYLNPGQVSPEALNLLITEVVPTFGFIRGCLYLYNKEQMMLVPSLRVGNTILERYRVLKVSDKGVSVHPAVIALSYGTPLIQDQVAVDSAIVSHITGALESEKKTMVLFLEMSQMLAHSTDRGAALIAFKAIRQTLADCIGLKLKYTV